MSFFVRERERERGSGGKKKGRKKSHSETVFAWRPPQLVDSACLADRRALLCDQRLKCSARKACGRSSFLLEEKNGERTGDYPRCIFATSVCSFAHCLTAQLSLSLFSLTMESETAAWSSAASSSARVVFWTSADVIEDEGALSVAASERPEAEAEVPAEAAEDVGAAATAPCLPPTPSTAAEAQTTAATTKALQPRPIVEFLIIFLLLSCCTGKKVRGKGARAKVKWKKKKKTEGILAEKKKPNKFTR